MLTDHHVRCARNLRCASPARDLLALRLHCRCDWRGQDNRALIWAISEALVVSARLARPNRPELRMPRAIENPLVAADWSMRPEARTEAFVRSLSYRPSLENAFGIAPDGVGAPDSVTQGFALRFTMPRRFHAKPALDTDPTVLMQERGMKRHESSSVKSMTLSTFVAACAFLVAPAIGATETVTPGPLPPERVNGNVIYLSGGIGQEEAAALRQNESNYPLALEFIRNGESGAEFLAGVSVTIKDPKGNVLLDVASEGPLLLAKLPDGRYKVIAAAENRAPKERDIVVAGRKHEHIVFVW